MADRHPPTCLITGSTSGIGRAAARELAARGARVVIVGRSAAKAEATAQAIRAAGGSADWLVADLSAQAEVRRLALEVLDRYPRLDVLVNNAGAIYAQRKVSADGIELTFALNHLGGFLLTNLLLDRLRASAPARIVTVASGAHAAARHLDPDSLERTRGLGGFYSAFGAYAISKLANILFTAELARRLATEQSGAPAVTATAMHPGLVHTGFGSGNGPLWALAYIFVNLLGREPEVGARTVVYLAAAPEVTGVTGGYFYDCLPTRPSALARDPDLARRLWEVSETMVGLNELGSQGSEWSPAARTAERLEPRPP